MAQTGKVRSLVRLSIDHLLSLWPHGYLLQSLVAREIKVRYRRSVLGIVWTLLNPLLMMIIFTIVFSTVFGNVLKNFAIYYLSASLSWQFFASSTMSSMTSMVRNSSLYKRVYVPKYIFVLAVVASEVINFTLSLVPLALLMAVLRHPLSPAILFLPVGFSVLVMMTLGVSFMVATIAVFFDDLTQFYQVILQALMYLSALFYPVSIVPAHFRILIELNPLYHVIELMRFPIYYGQLPPLSSFAVGLGTSVVALVIGWKLFSRFSHRFAYYV